MSIHKLDRVTMAANDTKKCRIIPKKYNYIPGLLLKNKRIEEETTMELNKAEIIKAMTLADVYLVNGEDDETLLTPLNFCDPVKESVEEDGGEETDPPVEEDDPEEVTLPETDEEGESETEPVDP